MKDLSVNTTKKIYFENLDFLRFFLALEVLVYHIPEISIHFGLPGYKGFIFQQKGVESVYWFFVLSGFLLSWLARKEVAQHRFSIKKFFIRRILRIWPVYYIVITIGILLYYFFLPLLNIPFENKASLSTTALLSYFFLSNILQRLYDPGAILIVTWSVSLEEQFYVFFPFWVRLFFKRKITRVTSTMLLLLLVIIIDVQWPWPAGILEYFEIYIEFFLIGILASEFIEFFMALTRQAKNILFYISLILLSISFLTDILIVFSGIYSRIFSGAVAAFVLLSLSTSEIKISNPFIVAGGKISYGIYMYHMIVITGLVYLIKSLMNDFAQRNQTLTIILLNITAICLTYLVAYVSYITIERFFLAKKPY